MDIMGQYTTIDVKATLIDSVTIEQLQSIANNKNYQNSKIVIMPDTHAGKDCVVGFTVLFDSNIKDTPISPDVIGPDIGCAMLVQPILDSAIDFDKLDNIIKSLVNTDKNFIFEPGYLLKAPVKDYNKQIGSLGRGNHFIEIDKGKNGYYIIIHTGSRHLGAQVFEYYKQHCVDGLLYGQLLLDYYNDVYICQKYAAFNRYVLMGCILGQYGFSYDLLSRWETAHNYIDFDYNIIRKGAISAQKNEKVLIPLNMRDGSIIGYGKGNKAWNYSAPHGAGRVASRKKIKKDISLEDYKASMQGIYSSCININTIDECAYAYKPSETIIDSITETVDIIEIIKPVYNFKNG